MTSINSLFGRTNIGSLPASKVVGILSDLDKKSQTENPHITWEGFTKFVGMSRRQHLLFEQGKNPFEQIPFSVLGECEYGYDEEFNLTKYLAQHERVKHDTASWTTDHIIKLAKQTNGTKQRALFVTILCGDVGYPFERLSYDLIRDALVGIKLLWLDKTYILRECCDDMALHCASLWGPELAIGDSLYFSGITCLKKKFLGPFNEYSHLLSVKRFQTDQVCIESIYTGPPEHISKHGFLPADKIVFYLEPK